MSFLARILLYEPCAYPRSSFSPGYGFMNETEYRPSVEVLAMGNIQPETRHMYGSHSLLSEKALEKVHEALKNLDIQTRYLWKRSTELFKTNTCLLDGHDHLAGER
jgi:hypothetical protein